jgi:hypothetical protein
MPKQMLFYVENTARKHRRQGNDLSAGRRAGMNQNRCLILYISVKTKEPIDEETERLVRMDVNMAIWKALDERLPRDVCCTVDPSFQSEREKLLDRFVTFRMISNVKIEDESPGNYYTALDAWKEFELLLEELRQQAGDR